MLIGQRRKTMTVSIIFAGCPFIFQAWVYEAIPYCNGLYGVKKSLPSIPRIVTWNTSKTIEYIDVQLRLFAADNVNPLVELRASNSELEEDWFKLLQLYKPSELDITRACYGEDDIDQGATDVTSTEENIIDDVPVDQSRTHTADVGDGNVCADDHPCDGDALLDKVPRTPIVHQASKKRPRPKPASEFMNHDDILESLFQRMEKHISARIDARFQQMEDKFSAQLWDIQNQLRDIHEYVSKLQIPPQ